MKQFRVKIIIPVLFLFLAAACKENVIRNQTPDPQTGSTEIMNYEYTNLYYRDEIARTHFDLNVEIDIPAIIKIPELQINPVLKSAVVSGTVIAQIETDAAGKVTNFTITKRGGLGLDETVEQIIPLMEIRPMRHKDQSGASKFFIRFIFSEHR